MNRVCILSKPVAHIRALTSTELCLLRRAGFSCSTGWLVSPNGGGLCGYLYRPAPRNSGCWAVNADILAFGA